MRGIPVSEEYRGMKSDEIIYTVGLLNTAVWGLCVFYYYHFRDVIFIRTVTYQYIVSYVAAKLIYGEP